MLWEPEADQNAPQGEAIEVLARLDATSALSDAVTGLLDLGQLPPALALATTYLGGLLDITRGRRPARALATLVKSTDSVLHGQLLAATHRRFGELMAETAAWEHVVARSDRPLSYVSYARALSAAGRTDKSQEMIDYVRRRLLAFDPRQPIDHPLMTPGRAMAFLATQQ